MFLNLGLDIVRKVLRNYIARPIKDLIFFVSKLFLLVNKAILSAFCYDQKAITIFFNTLDYLLVDSFLSVEFER